MATKKPTPARQGQGQGQAADEVAAAAQARKRDTIERQQQADSIAPRNVDPGEVARKAYERWQQRGGQHGSDQDDWYHAEQELKGGGGHAGGHQQ